MACLVYTSSTQTLTTPTGPSLAQPFSMAGVYKRTGAFTTRQTAHAQGTAPQVGFAAAANQAGSANGGAVVTASASDTNDHSIVSVFNSTSSSIVVDGTSTSVSLASTGSSGVFNIGPGASGNPLTGTVSEIGIWPRALSGNALCDNEYGFGYGTACGVIPPCTPNTAGGGTFANVMALWHFDTDLSRLIRPRAHRHSDGDWRQWVVVSTEQIRWLFLLQRQHSAKRHSNSLLTDFAMRTGDWTLELWATIPTRRKQISVFGEQQIRLPAAIGFSEALQQLSLDTLAVRHTSRIGLTQRLETRGRIGRLRGLAGRCTSM
jgi:hypothetical protein